jgi:hypothetical protein
MHIPIFSPHVSGPYDFEVTIAVFDWKSFSFGWQLEFGRKRWQRWRRKQFLGGAKLEYFHYSRLDYYIFNFIILIIFL